MFEPNEGIDPKECFQLQWHGSCIVVIPAPSVETMKLGHEATTLAQWAAFTKKYKAEMALPEIKHVLALLAVLSHTNNFSVGCYCEDENHCHRSILKGLLIECGAKVVSGNTEM